VKKLSQTLPQSWQVALHVEPCTCVQTNLTIWTQTMQCATTTGPVSDWKNSSDLVIAGEIRRAGHSTATLTATDADDGPPPGAGLPFVVSRLAFSHSLNPFCVAGSRCSEPRLLDL
jgi:hypothetical protein